MGFWQGLNQGLTEISADKARKRELEARQQEAEAEREFRRQESAADRAARREEFQLNWQQSQKAPLLALLQENLTKKEDTTGLNHNLTVLKGLGASDEVLEKIAAWGPAAAQTAVEQIASYREKYAGTPMAIGPAEINAVLGSGVATVEPGKVPDFESAAALYGIDPEKLDEPFLGGFTAREVLGRALTTRPETRVTFITEPPGEALSVEDVNNIEKAATKNLSDSLQTRSVSEAQELQALTEKKRQGISLTEEETKRESLLQNSLMLLEQAKKNLEDGSPMDAINLIGGQAIMPFIANNPNALNYNFGAGWQKAIQDNSYDSIEEVQAAKEQGKIKLGDIIILQNKIRIVQ